MIRKRPSRTSTVCALPFASRTCGWAAALTLTLAVVVPAGGAYGQAGYLTRDPNVSVDMSVLEELGSPATVAGQRLPAPGNVRQQLAFPPQRPPVSRLTGPLSNRQLSPLPQSRQRAAAAPRPTPAPPPPAVVETAVPPTPAPAKLEVRAAEASAPPPAPEPSVATADPPPAAPAKTLAAPAPPPPVAAAPVAAVPAPPPAPEPAPAPAREAAETPAPEPAAIPAPTPTAAPAPPVQTAAREDGASPQPSYRVLFDEQSAKISDTARSPLEELSTAMKASEDLRVQLLAYADGTSETASQARRLSLSRALAVRSFLINEGVRSTRMDVRALGNKAESGPADRVDAVLIGR